VTSLLSMIKKQTEHIDAFKRYLIVILTLERCFYNCISGFLIDVTIA